jgi:hypothetical protein
MAKVIKSRYEYVSLSDTPQAVPYPAGYSPALPSPPGVAPVSNGITVTDQYMSDSAVGVSQGYGVANVTGTSGATLPQATLNVPRGSNLLVYNTGVSRLALYTTGPLVSGGANTLLVWPCEPGRITSFPGQLFVNSLGLVQLSGASPSVVINTTVGTTFSAQIVWWQ